MIIQRIILFGLIIILTVPVFAFGDTWIEEEIDNDGQVGSYSSIIIDNDNNPHILYRDITDGCLKHCEPGQEGWSFDTVEAGGGGELSLAFKEDGTLCASYSFYLYDGRDIRYAEREKTNMNWVVYTVDYLEESDGYTHLSLAIDRGNNPHISYYDDVKNDLKYAKWDGSEWLIEVADGAMEAESNVGQYNSIAIDDNNSPHISYHDQSENVLKYASRDEGNWEIEVVDDDGVPGMWSSIALDSNNHPHISYSSGYPTHNLKYARWDGSTWVIETIFPERSGGGYPSLILDSNDNPHIAQSGEDGLEYVWRDDNTWRHYSIYHSGGYPSLTLDSIEHPHISYYFHGYYYDTLKYAIFNRSPNAFNLISPPDDTYVYEPITFVWETTDDGGQHDIHYNFWYSTEPDFTPREEITGLTESTFTLPIGTLDDLETYYWKVAASDGYEDTWSGCDIKGYWSFTVNERYRNIPKTFSLSEAYPNPSTGTAIIKFALPYACSIDLSLYDVKGRRITTLAEGRHQIGRHSITVTVLSGGVYLYKLEADEFSDVKKMVVR